ncbi:LysR family transcriptional regulator [Poseidonocella sedimentorum]|uniref:DNA-binding transcriptional regulator, LysR family n=1 Tax=Poseidonocella sedimentorum TaxID=871652 RepID=A0A1I6CV14_9RHOB|nr:LysR family transcriptional regulator [Poseidonocella sedimentorum]SFQ96943.1 DNA-binding transcriptional regulator, LysR family [Poseidonocella sedimentorum]
MQHWTELRTALMLARHGTVSAAAEALGVHRATVNRHVDTLEGAFQTKLFQRHARGYTLTESGQEMLEVAARADEMFADLAGRNRGRSGRLSGKLVVTALTGTAPLIMPALRAFHDEHPEIELEFAATADLARLEHGEAHVAFRAGPKPETQDYVVKLFRTLRFGLYASRDYVRRRGRPDLGNLEGHSFVGTKDDASRMPFARWMRDTLGAGTMLIKVTDPLVLSTAVKDGIGIGFLSEHHAAPDPELIEILPPSDDWSAPIWVVTHVDLHRTEKVQRFLEKL